MEEKEIEVNGKIVNLITKLPKEYIEENNLKIFLDDTVDLGEVVSKINADEIESNEEK